MEIIAGLILVVLGGCIYFLPAIVGANHRNATSIFLLNLFLGWSFIGWIAALIWATSKETPQKLVVRDKSPFVSDELQKLSSLKESGILTSEEFEKQKQKILGRF